MRRKIAAILVAHIADYGRLIADDEEETLRRMASYRSTTDDLIAIAGGRIFNAAGDAFLAEFPSAVEAVRCAIDIQESLRTRNLAYPAGASRVTVLTNSAPKDRAQRPRMKARSRPSTATGRSTQIGGSSVTTTAAPTKYATPQR
jgi:hypothetical protein